MVATIGENDVERIVHLIQQDDAIRSLNDFYGHGGVDAASVPKRQAVPRIIELFDQVLLGPIGERQMRFTLLVRPVLAHVDDKRTLPDSAQVGLAVGHARYVLRPSSGVAVLRGQHGGWKDNA